MDGVDRPVTAGSVGALEYVSVASIASPTELNSRVGTAGQKVLAVNGSDVTVYAWVTPGPSNNTPYVMAASGSGKWVAIGGEYSNLALSLASTLAVLGAITGSSTVKGTGFLVGANQVVGARVTGWGTPSSTLARSTFATYAGQTVANPPTQVQVQAIDDHLKILSQRLAALITDILAHGAIGA